MPMDAAAASAWWEAREVPEGHVLDCTLGPLSLQLGRSADEWRVAFERGPEQDGAPAVDMNCRAGELDVEGMGRYVFARTSAQLRLVPVLADRPVVIRPRQPVYLPSGESTTLYLSSPMFLRVEVGEPSVRLQEVAMVQLSDTWFGPSTREGELCYSGRTHARHSLEEVPRRPHRAITAVSIRNTAASPLPLEKLSLPVPVLSVYGCDDGSLWTQGLSLLRESETDLAEMKVDRHPPAAAPGARLLSAPRREAGRGGLVRAFSVLFGDG